MVVTRHVPITVLVPCFNSADVIEDCLESVTWADEIFVVDSFSTDATLEIASRYTNRIVQHEYVDAATQKNWAIPQARHEWVLIVDTDERVTPALRQDIERALTPDCPYDGFTMPRLNHVFGRPIRHGGHYPDTQLRLFRRDHARYQDRLVHAHVELRGRCGALTAPLLHYGQRDVEQVTRTYLLRYSAWEAEQKNRDGVRFHAWQLIVRPVGAFALRYLRQGGFRDGTAGLFMALLVSAYVFLTYARLWQMQENAAPPVPPFSSGQEEESRTKNPAPLRVAFLAPHTVVGGAEINLKTLVSSLDPAHVSPLAFVAGEGALTDLLAETGTPVICVPTPRFFSTSVRLGPVFGQRTAFNPLAVLADAFLLAWAAVVYARALRRARVQVIHTGSIFAHLLGILAAPLAGARLVWHVQDIVSPRLGGGVMLQVFARLGAWRADLVVCPSEAVAAGLRVCWPTARNDRLRVIHNGLDVRDREPGASRQTTRLDLGLSPDAFVVAHVGRLVPWKGQREFLRAAQLVARERQDARFLIVGDVASDGLAYRDDLHALARTLGLSDRVIFTGWRRDIPDLLTAADALVHSSTLPEPFGLVIVEAMAMERPVVAARLGGPREIVRDGKDGFLVDPANSGELAAAMLRLAVDPALRARMGGAGAARVHALFEASRFVDEMARVFQEVAGT